jgi:hypothetical protein
MGIFPEPAIDASDRFFETVRRERISRGVSRRRTSTFQASLSGAAAGAVAVEGGRGDSSEILASSGDLVESVTVTGAFDVAANSVKYARELTEVRQVSKGRATASLAAH